MGDAITDKPAKTISAPAPADTVIAYPRGIAIHSGIDWVLVISMEKPDMSDLGASVTVLEACTGKVLSTHAIGSKQASTKSVLVEVVFNPNADASVVHLTNFPERTLWVDVWNPTRKAFSFHQVDDSDPRQ